VHSYRPTFVSDFTAAGVPFHIYIPGEIQGKAEFWNHMENADMSSIEDGAANEIRRVVIFRARFALLRYNFNIRFPNVQSSFNPLPRHPSVPCRNFGIHMLQVAGRRRLSTS
jgi:hypothetical protein